MLETYELVNIARSCQKFKKISPSVSVGIVAAALVSDKGNIYTGICIEAPCGMGFCAEHSAIAEMLKKGESKIRKIVAVSSKTIVLPCGRCRELMRQIDKYNYENTEVIIKPDQSVLLSELLPFPFEL
ncbi:MAG: cytidine deaminase [Clostridia bacterium]|nr:cytidine deaminase [Clostridia bacterium]